MGVEEHENEYDEKESFFKKKISLVADEATLSAGKYAFPFSFLLPESGKKGGKLTGTFKVKENHGFGWRGTRGRVEDLKAKVEYSVKAVIDIDDSKDLEAKMDFTVYERLPEGIALPSDKTTANVMFFCCFNRGEVEVEATLDKNFYSPGETGQAVAKIRNDSSVEVRAAVQLNRIINLKADGHRIRDHDMKTLGRFDVVAPGEKKEVTMGFPIPNEMPSTDGKYVDCMYRMDIVAEVQCASDIECHFPVSIIIPPVEPTQWIEDINPDEYTMMSECAVEDMPLKPGYA